MATAKTAAKKTVPKKTASTMTGTEAVEAFMAQLEHPFKAEMEVLRTLILGIDSSVAEGIKWNVPSFRTEDYFATFNTRAQDCVQIIFHLGAKVRDINAPELINNDADLLKWLAKDRCMVTFKSMEDIAAKKAAMQAFVKHWIKLIGKG